MCRKTFTISTPASASSALEGVDLVEARRQTSSPTMPRTRTATTSS
jgi:hypothetical protein